MESSNDEKILINTDITLDKEIEIKQCENNIVNIFTPNISNANLPLSKNQMKKLKRQQDWDLKKKEIRKSKKLKKKEKKQNEKNNINKQETLVSNINEINSQIVCISRKEREEQYLNKLKDGIKVILDCGFEHLMNERDVKSMVRQIGFCYSINRRAEKPFNYILYDVGELTMKHLLINNFSNWSGVKLIRKGDWKTIDDYVINSGLNNKKEELIYLTADSENEINELKHEEVYVIGAIVDRNRYKNLTFNKANELNLKHARLPIGDYIHLNSSKVLTTNHVFSILSYFVNKENDWQKAFLDIIPKRKFND